jgi:protein ImuB
MQETLDRWGIRNFRGLATLPPVSLSERLGASGVRLQKLASGSAHRELFLTQPVLHFEETIELEYPVDVLEPLAFLIGRMLDGLCGRLSARALSTNEQRLRLKLEHRTSDEAAISRQELQGEPIVERKLALPVPMNDARLFLKLLQLELSAMPPGAPVTQLWLQAEPARPRTGQAGLFQPLAPEAQKLELTLARMHKLLAVRDQLRAGSVELLDTHQPDSFSMERFLPAEDEEQRSSKKPVSENAETSVDPLLVASSKNEKENNPSGYLSLRRFRPPLSATVELRDGVPVRMSCPEIGTLDPVHNNIIWAAGPWRTSGNWWEDSNPRQASNPESDMETVPPTTARHWNNEEWDIALTLTLRGPSPGDRTSQIGLYRLVHNCIHGAWCIEAGYD